MTSLLKPSTSVSNGSLVSKHSCEDCINSWRVQGTSEPPVPLAETQSRLGCSHPDSFQYPPPGHPILGVSLKIFGILVPDVTDKQPAEHCVDFSKFEQESQDVMGMSGLRGPTGIQGATGAQGVTGPIDPQAWGNPE